MRETLDYLVPVTWLRSAANATKVVRGSSSSNSGEFGLETGGMHSKRSDDHGHHFASGRETVVDT